MSVGAEAGSDDESKGSSVESGRLEARRGGNSEQTFGPNPRFRGVPDLRSLQNPTFWIGAAMLTGWAVGWIGYLTDTIPAWSVVVANTIADYLGFTVLHESVHRINLRNRRMNDALGWLPAFMLAFTYPVFRISHLNHHARTNDPDRDPDHWVSHRPRFLLPLWLVTTAMNYRVLFYRNGWGTPRQRRGQQGLDVILIAATVVAGLTGHLGAVLILYWIPWLLSGMFLIYAFDYLPHHPFTSTERYLDTRIQQGRIRHAILLGQNYHLIHHLWVSVPWFSYRKVYLDLEPELRKQGARIE